MGRMDEEKKRRARAMRAQGTPDAEIGRRLGVDRTTVFRSLGARSKSVPSPRQSALQTAAWPADRLWPEWDRETVMGKTGLPEDAVVAFWGLVEGATSAKLRFLVWYLRRLVEVAEAHPLGAKTIDEAMRLRQKKLEPQVLQRSAYWELLAGLPVLGVWARCEDACRELAELAEEHQPWIGVPFFDTLAGKALSAISVKPPGIARHRMRYRAAARPATEAIVQALRRELFHRAPVPSESGGTFEPEVLWRSPVRMPVVLALDALAERLPMADRPAPTRKYREFRLHYILVSIFATEPSSL